MLLTILEAGDSSVRAGYACPCGCTPSVEYRRGEVAAQDGCCCGNQFVIGPRAGASISEASGFRTELQAFAAPWGEQLEAAWSVGPSTHANGDHGHSHSDGDEHQPGHHGDGGPEAGQTIDPVCGMTVDADVARTKGLHSTYAGSDYFFCGKGCMLDFNEDPGRYLAPDYVPSM